MTPSSLAMPTKRPPRCANTSRRRRARRRPPTASESVSIVTLDRTGRDTGGDLTLEDDVDDDDRKRRDQHAGGETGTFDEY